MSVGMFGGSLARSWRRILQTPGTAAMAVLTIALGLAASGAAFMVADALIFHPLPPGLRTTKDLVGIYRRSEKSPGKPLYFSYPDFKDYRSGVSELADVAAFSDFNFTVHAEGRAARMVRGTVVSSNYFELLGVRPKVGRFFSGSATGDTRDAGDRLEAVISYGVWRSMFEGDSAVIGRALQVNGHDVTVVGVAPRSFSGTRKTADPALWVPLATFRKVVAGPFSKRGGQFERGDDWLDMVARLRPGVSAAKLQAALEVEGKRLAARYPATNRGESAVVIPLDKAVYGVANWGKMRRYCLLIGWVALATFLVACLDVANLLFARGLLRQEELGIRRMLGARGRNLILLLGEEAALLVVLGGACGLIGLDLALPLIQRLYLPVNVPLDLSMGWRVVALFLALCLFEALALAGFAAVGAMAMPGGAILRQHSGLSRRRRYGGADLLIAVQTMLAIAILVGSGLLLRSVRDLRGAEPRWLEQKALAVTVDLNGGGYKPLQIEALSNELRRRVDELPGVTAATLASGLPAIDRSSLRVDLVVPVEGAPAPKPGAGHSHFMMVDRAFFGALGVGVRRGRSFQSSDATSGRGVVLVNEKAANELFPRRNPVGGRVFLPPNDGYFTVVGVVPDLLFSDLREKPAPAIYLDLGQQDLSFVGSLLGSRMTLIARTNGETSLIAGPIRRIIQSLDPNIPIVETTTFSEVLSRYTVLERQSFAILAALGVIALVLALVGLYSLVTQSVVQRTREIGIRRALGARRWEGLSLLLKRIAVPLLAGVVSGLALSAWGARLVRSQLFGVGMLDLATYLLIALAVTASSLIVVALAARRSLGIEPLSALREP